MTQGTLFAYHTANITQVPFSFKVLHFSIPLLAKLKTLQL